MRRDYTNNPSDLEDTITAGAGMPSPQQVFSQLREGALILRGYDAGYEI